MTSQRGNNNLNLFLKNHYYGQHFLAKYTKETLGLETEGAFPLDATINDHHNNGWEPSH